MVCDERFAARLTTREERKSCERPTKAAVRIVTGFIRERPYGLDPAVARPERVSRTPRGAARRSRRRDGIAQNPVLLWAP